MKKILCIFLSVFSILFLSACSSYKFPSEGEGCKLTVDIYELYPNTGYHSFAKLKISSIYDDEYSEGGYTNSGGYIVYSLVIECVIEEDFYGVREHGMTIYMPLVLSSTSITYHYDEEDPKSDTYYEESKSETYYEKSELIEWLTEYDYLLAYFKTWESKQLNRKDDPAKEKITFYNMTDNCTTKYDSIIPVKDNKIDLENRYYNKASGYTYDLHGDYTKFLTDGMSLDTASENLRKLAKEAK